MFLKFFLQSALRGRYLIDTAKFSFLFVCFFPIYVLISFFFLFCYLVLFLEPLLTLHLSFFLFFSFFVFVLPSVYKYIFIYSYTRLRGCTSPSLFGIFDVVVFFPFP